MSEEPRPTRRPKLRENQTAEYLRDEHGIPIEPKTLRNWRASGKGPQCQYFGVTVLYDPDVLDRWATTEALTDKAPRRTRRQKHITPRTP